MKTQILSNGYILKSLQSGLPAPPVEHQHLPAPEPTDHQAAYEKFSVAIRELTADLDQMKKKLKSDMYRVEMNTYSFFQTMNPGWRPPFPPSPQSLLPQFPDERSDFTSEAGEPAI